MEKLKMHSPNLTEDNIARIRDLFPGCVTEARGENGSVKLAVDFDQLRQELSASLVEGPQERYHLNWAGKREALLTANAPIAKTLRPVRSESVDFDTTKNLFIEGDNLDALKLLQETYLGKVKLIYIDPPYNTGKDFIYKDNFTAAKDVFEQASGERNEAGGRLVSNPEGRGRFHTDWLNMIFPRLTLAKRLLSNEGVILISIDDAEQASLRRVCDQIFGEQNFVAQLVWEKGRKNDAKYFSVGHEYMLIYARDLVFLRERGEVWREEKPGAREIWAEFLRLQGIHDEDYAAMESALSQWYSDLPKGHPAKKWARYKRVDKHGPWRDRDISWPGGDGPRYDVIHPVTKKPCAVPERGWIYSSPEEMQRQIKLGLVEFRADHTEPPFRKAHIRPISDETAEDLVDGDEESGDENDETELATQVRGSYFYKQSQVAVKYLRKLMGAKVFSNPKDHEELARLIEYLTPRDREAIVMDFFAGSGTTAQAVLHANANYGTNHRFILVQLPESLEEALAATTGTAKKTVQAAINLLKKDGRSLLLSEVTKERIRRARNEVEKSEVDRSPGRTGFRVLKIDTSNMADVYYAPDALDKANLDLFVDNIKSDRTAEDLLFQVMLDWGVDLALPIEKKAIQGKDVFFVDGDALAACFDARGGVDEAFVKELAAHKPLRVVFRDAGFKDSAVKINVEQIFKLLSPSTEVKSI
ncbi:site-specific DNA-methyltransferase [Achromobacter ruhlandii]|uniref:site-specific DNA-methyltransferase n=1 Tax=Achromobacter ruhlandii TaxID=72557 RepID=UPI000C266F1B|nr:site-specific DNA-methyltransferase [Achromobacter ruhlandii]PJM71257.1 site-specific DNA-methyltransferase [Achromobacter ruhlandii]